MIEVRFADGTRVSRLRSRRTGVISRRYVDGTALVRWLDTKEDEIVEVSKLRTR